LRDTSTIIPISKVTIGTKLLVTSRAGFKPSFLMRCKGARVSTPRTGFQKVRSFYAGFTDLHVVFGRDFENEFVFVKKVEQWA
jgi:hypothetical protein